MSESFNPDAPQLNNSAPTWKPTPGVFDHRGLDCEVHGGNVIHARSKGTTARFDCVRCLLELCVKLEAEEDGRTQP